MQVFNLTHEAEFNTHKHVEKILGKVGDGDVTVACWEPGQISPYHCHPHATEIYFCFEGGGTMRTPERERRGGARRLRGASARRGARIRERARSARCCSACATAATWRRGTWNGAAARAGRKARKTPNISANVRVPAA